MRIVSAMRVVSRVVSPAIKALVEDVCGGPPFAIGDVVLDQEGKRKVEIVAGQYWGEAGLSNHWSWREVLPDGSLGQIEHGYGWRPPKQP